MPDWIDALQARGLLTGTQARELRTLRPEGARQMPPRPEPEPEGGKPETKRGLRR